MLSAIRPKLTFANVMVVLLAFVVLGGGAYAATSLPRNSVGTAQIRGGAVTPPKLSKQVLRELASANSPGPAGPQGPRGEQGPKGDSATPGGTIPVGVTLRGAAITRVTPGSPSASKLSATGVSFGGFQLPARPLAHVVPVGGPSTPEFPGSAGAPEAKSWNLCVYAVSAEPEGSGTVSVLDPSKAAATGLSFGLETSTSTVQGDGRVATFGFDLTYIASSVGIGFRGTWAVTG